MTRRVVITGIGITSCLGTDPASVTESLREGHSGISFQQEYVDIGMRSHVAGSIDLCYRDPETAEWVVADYKTDRVASDADVAQRVAIYTDQGRTYQRALREAFGLQSDPRFELWFLDADRVEVVA